MAGRGECPLPIRDAAGCLHWDTEQSMGQAGRAAILWHSGERGSLKLGISHPQAGDSIQTAHWRERGILRFSAAASKEHFRKATGSPVCWEEAQDLEPLEAVLRKGTAHGMPARSRRPWTQMGRKRAHTSRWHCTLRASVTIC